MDGLLELLVVEDGPHLAVAVAGPVGSDDLDCCATDILPVTVNVRQAHNLRLHSLLSAGAVDVGLSREVCLPPSSVVTTVLLLQLVQQLLHGALQHVPPEPLLLAVGPHHPGRGLDSPRLLRLSVHSLDQSFVLVYEP